MASSVTTRPLELGDYDAVVALWRSAEGVELAEGDARADIAAYLERNPGLSRVACAEGRIVGALLCGHDGRRGVLYHLAVAAERRGRGVGRRLVDECLAGLRRSGLRRAIILVASDNPSGRAFWRSRGFDPIDAGAMGVDL